MSEIQRLREFDEGVERAQTAFAASEFRRMVFGFGDEFASFSLHDISAASSPDPAGSKFVRLDGQNRQPILWQRVHQPLAGILRAASEVGPHYAGFATLFTINPDSGIGSQGNPRYYSMAIDCRLDAPGLSEALLSRLQFAPVEDLCIPPDERPLPLTAVCLNSANVDDFKTVPIVFYWHCPSQAPDYPRASIPPELASWGHVFVSARIPYPTFPI
jgi:hypothetical protein